MLPAGGDVVGGEGVLLMRGEWVDDHDDGEMGLEQGGCGGWGGCRASCLACSADAVQIPSPRGVKICSSGEE